MDDEINSNYELDFFHLPPNFSVDRFLEFLKKRKNQKIVVQAFDLRWVVSKRQVKIAIYHVLKAFRDFKNIAKEKSTEFIIRLSGEHQIKKAFQSFGLTSQSEKIAILVFGSSKSENEKEREKILEYFFSEGVESSNFSLPLTSLEKLSTFYKSKKNLAEIEKKALEKMAILEII